MTKLTNVKLSHQNFGPYLARTVLPNYIIKKLLSEGKKTKKSYNRSLAGHLNNQFLYPENIQQWFYNEINPVIAAYRQGHCKFHGIQDLSVDLHADDLWINFMKPGDFNPIHTHSGDYSFVIFLDVPKIIEKEMKDYEGTSGRPGQLMFEFTQQARPRWATTGLSISPQVGEMYIFPALLQHWVAPFKSKCTRISVSGNLRITNKDKLPHDYF